MASARNARSGCSIRWSWRSRSSRVRPPRTKSPPSGPWPRPPMSWPSPASIRRASPSPSICRVSGWSSRDRRFAVAAAARDCEKISQAPAPFHVLARGWAGPSLLAMILFEKYGQHQPLNRQSERYAREGVPLSLSTLADQVGACCAVLTPLLRRLEAHVFAAERLHGDDTIVPVLATGKTDTGRCWVYVRDDRLFGGR